MTKQTKETYKDRTPVDCSKEKICLCDDTKDGHSIDCDYYKQKCNHNSIAKGVGENFYSCIMCGQKVEQIKECPTCKTLKESKPTPDGDEVCSNCGDREMMDKETSEVPSWEELTKQKIWQMLFGAYNCGRDWEAWQVGTMTREDFSPLREDEEFIDEIFETIKSERKQAVEEVMKTKISKKELYIRGLDEEAREHINLI